MVTTLRYHRRVEGSDANQQEWDAGYSLRAATSVTRQRLRIRPSPGGTSHYVYLVGPQSNSRRPDGGRHHGASAAVRTLCAGQQHHAARLEQIRYWIRWAAAGWSTTRSEYRYRLLDVFYDSGAIWDSGQTATPAALASAWEYARTACTRRWHFPSGKATSSRFSWWA